MFKGIGFLHDTLRLTHTDLKPENLLFKYNDFKEVRCKDSWPKVRH
jgi:hypothetical protein